MSEDLGDLIEALRRFGLASEVEKGSIIVKRREVIIASGRKGAIRLKLKGNTIMLEDGGLLRSRKYEVPRDARGLETLAPLIYYSWVEANRGLQSKLSGYLVRAARRARAKRGCVSLFERLGLEYHEGDCTRLASLLAYGIYKYRVLAGISIDSVNLDGVYFPPKADEEVYSLLSSYLSLLRTFADELENVDEVVSAGNSLFERYGYMPDALKIDLDLSSYLDRLTYGWRVYLVALSALSKGVRLSRPPHSVALTEAALMGETLWARTGNGTVAVEPNTPVSSGLALVHYNQTGSKLSIIPRGSGNRGLKCVTRGSPSCRDTSIVVDPGYDALESALTAAKTGEAGVEIVYYSERPLVIVISRCLERLSIGSIGMGGRISMVDSLFPEKLVSWKKGVPRPDARPGDLGLYSKALGVIG
ncbi:MAG: hypothetical protein F7C35_05030 [Desulfurococcales archaeon]|nr:hypothetical protein [Desulfurococcales archaeon]